MNIKAFTEKTLSDLRAFGLTGHEAAIYLALIEHSSSTASEVCTYCGIPDSKVYIALNSLLSKGMIIAQNSTPKIYSVNPPAEAIELLKNELRTVYEAKFKDADELIDTLTLMYEANNENEVSGRLYNSKLSGNNQTYE